MFQHPRSLRIALAALILALLAPGTPLRAQAVPAAAAGASPRSAHFTTSDGVRLHYLDAGRGGPVLLFVPGWTMPAEIWMPQIEALAAEFRVVALDPRSQGESAPAAEGHYLERRAQDIAELINHLKLADVVLVGWSLAVPEVLTYTEQHGSRALRGVVLVDGFVGADPDPAAPNPLRPMLLALQRDRRAYTEAFVRSMFRRPPTDAYLDRLTELSLRTPTSVAFTLLANLMLTAGDWRPALQALERPVLYVVQPSLESQAQMVRALKPTARVEVFREAGHALFVDEPARFNALLRDFARQSGGG